MVLEIAVLEVFSGQESEFQRSFEKAQRIIAAADGYIRHELRRCLEKSNRYILLATRETLEAHDKGFRESMPRLTTVPGVEPCEWLPTVTTLQRYYELVMSSLWRIREKAHREGRKLFRSYLQALRLYVGT